MSSVSATPESTEFQVKAQSEIIEEFRDGVVWLIINRPHRRNALSPSARAQLTDGISRAGQHPSVAAIVIMGQGEEAFCSGGDQSHERGLADADLPKSDVTACYEAMRRSRVPIIAAVRGWAVGGGCTLSAVCDLTVAAENAKFYYIETRLGSVAAGFAVAYLARVVGEKKAREMWYLGRIYDAEEAKAMNLVNEVFPLDGFTDRVQEYAQTFIRRAPTTLQLLKASFEMAVDPIRHMSNDYVVATMARDFDDDPEIAEGVAALHEKRDPDFSHWRQPRGPRFIGPV
jgi:1,4-dihydroxy-2-naphthoyl-CoA synthase